jgi:tetratricopeptide (TPR) repeat protein
MFSSRNLSNSQTNCPTRNNLTSSEFRPESPTGVRSRSALRVVKGRSRCWLALGVALSVLACGFDSETQLEEIVRQQERGEFATTIGPLRELLQTAPDDPELNHLYGVALLGTQAPEHAIWPLRKAAQHPDRAIDDGLLLARALLRGGSPADAVEQVLRVYELAPDWIEVVRLLLEARLAARQHEEALEAAALLLDLEPEDLDALLARLQALLTLDRADEAEQAFAEFQAAIENLPGESPWRAQSCAAEATFTKERGGTEAAEAAEAVWEDCLEKFPGKEILVFGAIEFFAEQSKHERIEEILRAAHAAEPAESIFVETLANQLGASGRTAEAEQLLRSAAMRDGGKDPGAWLSLARYHGERGETARARDYLAQGMRLMDEAPATLVAAYVDLLIRAGDYDEAEKLIVRFEASPAMLNLLRGRLFLARGHPAQALEALEEGLRLWPDHSVARWLAGTAAEQLGDFDRAVREYGESIRNDRENRDAVLSLLRLLEALHLDREALPTLARYRQENPDDPEMLVQTIRFAYRAGAMKLAEGTGQILLAMPGQRGVAVAELAAIRAKRGGPAEGAREIRAARLDLTHPRNGEALAPLIEYLVAAGRPAKALEATQAALAAHPDEALFHELRGRALRGAGDAVAAREAFQRALELDPQQAAAQAQLAALAAEQGDRETAIALYDQAELADPEDATYAWGAIQLVGEADHGAELDRRLEALLLRHPTHAAAAEFLARRLRSKEPERAFDLARRAGRLRKLAGRQTRDEQADDVEGPASSDRS